MNDLCLNKPSVVHSAKKHIKLFCSTLFHYKDAVLNEFLEPRGYNSYIDQYELFMFVCGKAKNELELEFLDK